MKEQKLEPKICGRWDGCALWLQWNPPSLESSGVTGDEPMYELQIRYRKNEDAEWGDWIDTIPPQGAQSAWGVVPTWKEGWQAQARARVKEEGRIKKEEGWEDAAEVTFLQCWAIFEISSAKYEQHFQAGFIFHAQVDGAACAYQTRDEINVKAGGKAKVKLFALGSSGYFQLDHENHFDVQPAFGVRVRNLEPSVEDVEETGRGFTVIEPKKSDPVTMTVTPPKKF